MIPLTDKYGRLHDYLRFSLTDKCNLNCFYCNPADGKKRLLKSSSLLSVGEIVSLVELFVIEHGIRKIRFTGGEPLLRKDLPEIFERLSNLKENYPFKMAITSNGTTLFKYLDDLQKSGLDRVNISLDTLDKEKFKKITGYDLFENVIRSIDQAEEAGFDPVKINTVIIRGVNDNEILDFIEFVRERQLNVRFIEFMPFANNNWSSNGLISAGEIREIISKKYQLSLIEDTGTSVAKNFRIDGYPGRVSFISSLSDHFCSQCNRLRISSDGKMKLCLFTNGKPALNFLELLRNGSSREEISGLISKALQSKNEKHLSADEILQYTNNEMLSLGG